MMESNPTFDESSFLSACLGILNSPDATLDDYLTVAKALKVDLPARFTWRPRPDQPEKYDQQTAFYNCDSKGVIWLLGGNGAGCLGAEQEVYDPVLNVSRKVSEIDGPFHVWARTASGEVVVAKASKPKVYGREDLYRVNLSNGHSVIVTLGHRVLDARCEWREVGNITREPFAISRRLESTPLGGMIDSLVFITSIEYLRHDEYWDFSVEEHENYWMAGAWHHNTTETTMAKVAKLVRTIPAPRKDTPFWIIAGSYDQSMNTCWKEKLYGHGHITDEQIDWARVEWYRPKSQLPFKVPLLPQPCQKDKALFRKHVPEKFPYAPAGNWFLEFKSWRQGDHQMMAQSIGGFAFVEQFPWDVFTETMRGCREYFLPGSMLVEYTPVDPDLSGDIEAMIQGGPEPERKEDKKPGVKYLPRGWEVFHANTECALEAGHVAKEWFDQYFGMIPGESRDMRLKGLFASFEGVIYKTFDPTVHIVGDEIFEWIAAQGCYHRRALDWGAGPHNAFACLWGAKNHFNQWFIYDEYYSVDQEATVIDHLVNISQQQFWPENHPLYGTTYVDPARPDNIRLAQQLAMQIKRYGTGDEKETVKNMNITLARNSVFEGIEHVQWLLKKSVPEWNEFAGADGNGGMILRPRLFIHHSCTNLIREMKKYRWIKQTGIGKTENPVSARPEPLKLDDHCCFASDTLVVRAGKNVPIGKIKAGDILECRSGRCEVVTGWTVIEHLAVAWVVSKRGSSQKFTVTPDHKFFIDEQWQTVFDLVTAGKFEQFEVVRVDVGCIATTAGEFMLSADLIAKNCDALRYLVFSDDSKCGLTIDSVKKQSKAAQTVHGKSGQNANWRDIISNHGESAIGERYGRTTAGKRRGIAGRDVRDTREPDQFE